MPVIRRTISTVKHAGLLAIGAAGRTLLLPTGTDPVSAQAALGADARLFQIGRGMLAVLPKRDATAEIEAELLADRNVMIAFRRAETAQATRDWLFANGARGGADGAVIVLMCPAVDADAYAVDLERALSDDPSPVLLLSTERALSDASAPDQRDPATAPDAREGDVAGVSAWSGPLIETGILEIVRRRYLCRARAVATLEIADTLLSARDESPFDLADRHAGSQIALHGVEAYPWRRRGGMPPLHRDHVAVRLTEPRWISGWCAKLSGLPDHTLLRPGHLPGVPTVERNRVPFSRAVGVVYPDAPLKRIVRRADLVEDPLRVRVSRAVFGGEPLRSKRAADAPDRPTGDDITVVTAMKDEGPFIVDWIAHLTVIGVGRVLVYTNDCSDGTDRLLDALTPAGVARRDNPYREVGGVPQHAAFRAAEDEPSVRDASWLLTLDVDEFPNVHTGDGTLQALVEASGGPDLVSLPWRLFGNSDVEEFSGRPVFEEFTRAAPHFAPRPLQAWGFKTVYRNAGLFRRLGVHRPRGLQVRHALGMDWRDGSGRPMPPHMWKHGWRMTQDTWGYDLAQINHYALRSAESFLVKRARGRVNHTSRPQDAAYWFRMNHNQELDTTIARYAERVAKVRRSLMALPGVAALHEEAVAWHRERIGQLRRRDADFLALITSDRMRRLSRLTTRFGMRVFEMGPHVIPDDIANRSPDDAFFFTIDGEDADGTERS